MSSEDYSLLSYYIELYSTSEDRREIPICYYYCDVRGCGDIETTQVTWLDNLVYNEISSLHTKYFLRNCSFLKSSLDLTYFLTQLFFLMKVYKLYLQLTQ